MSAGDCPDYGACHHDCGDGPCFRVQYCGPLSGVYPDDEWPVDVKMRHAPDDLDQFIDENMEDPEFAEAMDRLALAQRLLVVEPVITAHLTDLRMDTDEDNALLDEIRSQWHYVMTGEMSS